jgi:hypothetical protein
METTTFTALCERAGRWWTIRVPQVEGLTTQVRNLDQAEVITRQKIAASLGIPLESVRVDVLPDAPAPVVQALKARHAARQAVEVAGQATLAALEALAREGYPFHDAATMLGLSPGEIAHYGPAGFRPQADPAGPRPQADPAATRPQADPAGARQHVETAPNDIPDPHPDSGPLQTAGQ